MELQTAFYIIGIVFMGLMIIMFIALLAAVLVIKAKINKAHDMLSEKMSKVTNFTSNISMGIAMLKRFVKK